MAQIVLKSKGIKGTCIICNCAPVDETKEDRPQLPMFHAVGVDVNWGEDCNICQICAGVMADMLGRASEIEVARLSKAHQALVEEHDAQDELFSKYRARVRELVDGKKAHKQLREMNEEIEEAS